MVTMKSPRALVQPRRDRRLVPGVGAQPDDPQLVPLAVQTLEDGGGQVGAAVVDADDLVAAVEALEDGTQPVDEERQDVLLVVHGDDHRQHRMHVCQVTAAASRPLCVRCPVSMNVLMVLPDALQRSSAAGRCSGRYFCPRSPLTAEHPPATGPPRTRWRRCRRGRRVRLCPCPRAPCPSSSPASSAPRSSTTRCRCRRSPSASSRSAPSSSVWAVLWMFRNTAAKVAAKGRSNDAEMHG